MILTVFPCHLPMWPVQNVHGSWRKLVDYHKLSQVVTPIGAAVPDVASLFEQINISPSMQQLIWQRLFFHIYQ